MRPVNRLRRWHREHVVWVDPPGFTRFYFCVSLTGGFVLGFFMGKAA